jgi:hypothetical protein
MVQIHFLHSVIQARPRGSFANFLCRLQPACLPYVQFRLKWTNSHGLTTIWTSLPDLQTSPNNPLGLPRIGPARHYLRPPPPPPPLPPPLPPPAIFSPSSAILPRFAPPPPPLPSPPLPAPPRESCLCSSTLL